MPIVSQTVAATARAGRVLVECLVSLVLVSGASSLVMVLASTTAHVVDHARQRDLVLRESASSRAFVLQAPCLAHAGTPRRTIGPRTVLEATVGGSGALHAVAVRAEWLSSGLGGVHRYTFRSGAAGWCE